MRLQLVHLAVHSPIEAYTFNYVSSLQGRQGQSVLLQLASRLSSFSLSQPRGSSSLNAYTRSALHATTSARRVLPDARVTPTALPREAESSTEATGVERWYVTSSSRDFARFTSACTI